jgi:hypothetical protein
MVCRARGQKGKKKGGGGMCIYFSSPNKKNFTRNKIIRTFAAWKVNGKLTHPEPLKNNNEIQVWGNI